MLFPRSLLTAATRAVKPHRAARAVVAARGRSRGGGGQGLTPYQGSKRTYGYFRCPSCKRKWESGNSWADCGQDCKTCNIRVYPFRQVPLQKAEDGWIDVEKPHREDLCEKCQQLGFNCRELDKD